MSGRALMQKSIAELEAMATRNSKNGAELALIFSELGHRQTARATALRAEIAKMMMEARQQGEASMPSNSNQHPNGKSASIGLHEPILPGLPGGPTNRNAAPEGPLGHIKGKQVDADPIDPKSAAWLRAALAKLRDKLIDLSKRNPLVSFKHSERGATYLRIIDELPDHLFASLQDGVMKFDALPTADETPKDELTPDYKIAWERARLTDAAYLAEIEKLGEGAEDEMRMQDADRALRARVRAGLGLPRLATGKSIDIAALARAHGFDPSFELRSDDDADAKHLRDDKIRVLLTADRLETRLRTIHDRYRGHAAETGLHTLYVAFGFVEWFEDETSKLALHAPALILPVTLDRSLERSRYVFAVTARDEDLQINVAMRELLRQKFHIEVPKLREDETPESYFVRLGIVLGEDPRLRLSLRRFVTLAVLPFPRMVLWQDLDPGIWPDGALDNHPLLPQLLGAKNAEGGGAFREDYAIDEPEMSARVPHLVLDADVSQHSALVDVGEGRSLAIEGPPGTGKSQTITNMIATALDQGKRVLFVAEKQAALDVVAKRLREIGFGPLLLQLHSDRATKTEVLRALDERLKAEPSRGLGELETLRTELRDKRNLLRRYLGLLNQPLGKLGRSVHRLVWRELALRDKCASVPAVIVSRIIDDAAEIGELDLKRARETLDNISVKASDISRHGKSPWQAARHLPAFDQTLVMEAAKAAMVAADLSLETTKSVETDCGFSLAHDDAALIMAATTMSDLPPPKGFGDRELRTALRDKVGVAALLKHGHNMALARDQAVLAHPAPLSADREQLGNLAPLLIDPKLPATHKQAIEHLASSNARITALDHIESKLAQVQAKFGTTNDAPFRETASVFSAVTKMATAPDDVVALRSVALLNDQAGAVISAANAEAFDLKHQAETLGQIFQIDEALRQEASQLDALIETIEGAGLFGRLFSGVYKSSWRNAAQLLREPLKRSDALDALRKLHSLVFSRKSFFDDHAARAFFSRTQWQGVESDWAVLTATHALLNEIADNAANAGLIGIAEIVATEPIRNLRAFAQAIESVEDPIAVVDFSGATSINQERDTTQVDIARLKSLVDALRETGISQDATLCLDGQSCAQLIIQFQDAAAKLNEKPDGGEVWDWYVGDGANTDLSALGEAANYVSLLPITFMSPEISHSLVESDQPARLIEKLHVHGPKLRLALAEWRERISGLCDLIEVPVADFLRNRPDDDSNMEAACELLKHAVDDEAGLRLYADLQRYLKDAEEQNCRFVHYLCLDHGVADTCFADLYELLVVRSLLRHFLRSDGKELERLGGLGLTRARSRFTEIDNALHAVEAKRIVAQRLLADRAPEGIGSGPRSSWTELSLIRHQIGLQKRHIPIRDLAYRAGAALSALKPVWMMSPTSVAQYVRPDTAQFDLVVMDEASQMRPEFAVGAIARGAQLVVVGDSNQLPPTDFFNVATNDELDDDDFAIDTESILDLANEKLPHKRALNWHYRSEHESLIQFSNRQFYDRRLVVFPSPTTDDPLLGVKHVFVGGTYEAQINQIEAQAVIEEAIGIMLTRPELSMGIATMNIKQRDLIWAEFERIAAQEKDVQSYLELHSETIEPFFVKNLENVQGDERDVILISTVYGPDKNGHVFQRFGPLNSKVGHRRLNVLITRAKQTTRVFTSLRPDDIKPSEGSNRGVFATQGYLRYAAGGATTDDAGGGEPDSDFEVFVADRLRDAGYEVVHQVGVEGFRIDLGVRHPSFPLGFIAGVECDGASFHSGLTVRDRDKIRQNILEKLGWKIWRIWSTDWFADADRECARLLAALEAWRDEAAATFAARQNSGEFAQSALAEKAPDFSSIEVVATTTSAPPNVLIGLESKPSELPDNEAVPVAAARDGPEGKHRVLDDIDWYETMRGTWFEVWPDGQLAGDIEVLSRGTSAPKVYGNTIAVQKSQYRCTVTGSGKTFIVDDLYVAVRKIAKEARDSQNS